jgi:hypothetical protein
VPHIVGVEKSKNVSRNEGRGYVHIDYGRGVNLTVIGRAVKRQLPFYKRVRGVEMGPDIARRRFTAVLVADAEGDVGRASIVFEAGWDLLRLVGRSVRRARDGVILKSTTTKGGLL